MCLMSIEVKGFDRGRDGRIADAVASAAAHFCLDQGMSESEALITASRGGQYAAEVLLAALTRIGAWPPADGVDTAALIDATTQITSESGVPF